MKKQVKKPVKKVTKSKAKPAKKVTKKVSKKVVKPVIKKWNFVNSWISSSKQTDKFNLTFRIGKFTILKVKIDSSKKEYSVMFFNFGYEKV
jgi:hypothetical protein